MILLLADGAAPVDLSGTIIGEDQKPILGATVYVYSAAPKKGAATINAFDYPDCAKSAVADATGAFTIVGVDSNLTFRLLVVADGRRPLILKKVDPARGAMKARLKEFPKDLEADHMIKGHVADS